MANGAVASNDNMQVSFKIDVPYAVMEFRDLLADGIRLGFRFVAKNFKTLIIDRLLYGGKGWKSLQETAGWKWMNSPKGFAQLGFSNPLEPLRLLVVLSQSFYVKEEWRFNKQSGSVYIGFKFGWANLGEIISKTIHPAAGTLGLAADRSWFEWMYAGKPISEKRVDFKKTGPGRGVRSSAIAGGEAGIMKPGSGWEVPPSFRIDLEKLFVRNEDRINKVIRDTVQDMVTDSLK